MSPRHGPQGSGDGQRKGERNALGSMGHASIFSTPSDNGGPSPKMSTDENNKPRTNSVARLAGVLLFAALTLVCFRFDLTIGIAVFGVLTIVVLVGR